MSDTDPNTTYILDKFRKFEESQNATDGAMMRRISLLENDLRGLMAKHTELVAAVYAKKEARNGK